MADRVDDAPAVGCRPSAVSLVGQSGRTTDSLAAMGAVVREATGTSIGLAAGDGLPATCHPCDRRPQLEQRRNIAPSSHQTEYSWRPVSLQVSQLGIGAP